MQLLTLGNNEFLIFHIKRSPFGLFITGISSSVSLFEDLKSVSLDIKKRLMALLPIVYNALDKTLIDKAAEELRENEGNLSTGLKQLRQLIEKESIVCPRDDAFLTMFLRAKKWNVQRSFYQLKMYCHVRLQHERIYGCYELEAVRKVLSLSVCGLLPARDHEGRVVIFIRLNQFDADFMSGEDVMTTLKLLAHFVIQYHATQINGLCFISNCWLKSLRHAQILMKTLANTLSIISHFPARIRRVDNVNSNVLFQTAFSLLKVIVPLKVFKRCTFLGDQKEVLPQIYPPSILPEEFGGTLGPLKDIKNEWMSDFEKYVLKYKAESSYYFEK